MNTELNGSPADAATAFARPQAEIDALARETHTESTVVRKFYESAVAQLQAIATVRPFISVIAWRHVSISLRKDAAEREQRFEEQRYG